MLDTRLMRETIYFNLLMTPIEHMNSIAKSFDIPKVCQDLINFKDPSESINFHFFLIQTLTPMQI